MCRLYCPVAVWSVLLSYCEQRIGLASMVAAIQHQTVMLVRMRSSVSVRDHDMNHETMRSSDVGICAFFAIDHRRCRKAYVPHVCDVAMDVDEHHGRSSVHAKTHRQAFAL